MKKEMLINVLQPEECRIAIVEDGVLEELYVERASQESYVGNIYKGRIVNIEPSIQAVFVDFGIGRNGFLHVSDVDPVYYKHLLPKDVVAEMEAAEAGEFGGGGGGGGGRSRDRGDRGDRRNRDRGDRGDRGPRPMRTAEPESAVTVSRVTPTDSAPPGDDEDDSGFGVGLLDDDESIHAPTAEVIERSTFTADIEADDEPPPVPAEAIAEAVVEVESDEFNDWPTPETLGDEPAPVVGTVVPAEEEEDKPTADVEPEAAVESKGRPKGRARAKKKSDEPDAEEAKAKPKARRPRKKADAEPGSEAPDEAGEDKPRPMGGAERRTSPEDEPEIKPFFDDNGVDDFDPDAPNDRFAEGAEAAPVEGDTFADAGDDEEEVYAEPVAVTGDDDDEFAPPPRRNFDDEEGGRGRGGRPRGRGRGRRPGGGGGGPSSGGRPPARDRGFPRPPIQEIFKRGQEVIVQVIKEGIGTKGPTLSTFVSIAGRYLVLMPSLNRVGVSRKIEDPDARRRLRDIMNALNPPKGVGFIVRTAAIDRNEQELHNDLAYLLRLWQVVVRRIKKVAAPVEIYRESDMITRTIRDIFTSDVDAIWVDEPNAFAHASEFLQIVMPRFAGRIRYFEHTEPLFHKYGIEDEIAKINHKRLEMPQGGSIIIEQTEALVAIDVNSGNFRAENDAEETAFRMNLMAAKEIARQLRLRDLGGVIVNDFIDMRREEHRRKVEQALRDALKRDRARTKILRISDFGIIEMTRQRIQPSLKKRVYNDCPHCKGTGYIKTNETIGIEVMRLLQLAVHRSTSISSIVMTLHSEAAFYLLNRKRREIAALEEKSKVEVQINGQPNVSPDLCDYKCFDANGNEVRLFSGPPPRAFRGGGPRQFPDRRPPNLD